MSGIVGSRLNIRGSGLIGGLGSDGQVLTSAGAGQEIVFESLSAGAISALNNATVNELVSVGSTTTELDAEANLTFTGSALTCIGTVTVGVDNTGHDVKYFGATSGSYWLWDEDADGVVQIGTLTVGVDDAGHDVKFFGNAASAYMLWDTSADDLILAGAAGLSVAGATATAAITASGIIKTDDTTAATSTTDGSLQTDGGLSVALDAVIGDDLLMLSDASVIHFGADSEVTLTHVHNDGLLLNSDNQLQFRDSAINIRSDADGDLDINADDEIELNSTLIDINGNVEISGTATTTGVHTFSATPVFPDGSLALADLDIDGGTDIGAAIVDADLFIVDDGAGGTNRKVAASRLKTYAAGGANTPYFQAGMTSGMTLTHDVITLVNFDRADVDSASGYDTTNKRYVIPSGQGGFWHFGYSIIIEAADADKLWIAGVWPRKNGSDFPSFNSRSQGIFYARQDANPSYNLTCTKSFIGEVAATNYVDIYAYMAHSDAGLGAAGDYYTQFWGFKLAGT